MESFTESLNRLKDIHEKEVLGLQNKLLELNSGRCRDAQRMEELFAKNQHLREQQKALQENVRVLENRLRAGLCDRCVVTQELARKKQRESESSRLQGLHQIFLLTNEMTRLREENKGLKEEVKRLRGLEDRPEPLSRESSKDSLSPLLLPSPSGQKASDEKSPQDTKEPETKCPGMDPRGEEQPLGYRTPPVTKISPGANLAEPRAPDAVRTGPRQSTGHQSHSTEQSPQHISNQLHGTIAVVRSGSRLCPPDHNPINGTPLPPTGSSPPSPNYEPSLDRPNSSASEWSAGVCREERGPLTCPGSVPSPVKRRVIVCPPRGPLTIMVPQTLVWPPFHSLLRASRPPAAAFEALKRSLQADHLGLLNCHLALRFHSPLSSPLTPTTVSGSPRPKSLKARETQGWEEPAGLPGTLADMRDPRPEGILHLLLAQQQPPVPVGSARPKGLPVTEGLPPSPLIGSDSEGSEGIQVARAVLTTAAWHGGQCPQPANPNSLTGEAPEKPLDLSDRSRGHNAPRPACRPESLSHPTTDTPSPESPQGAEPAAQSGLLTPGPQTISNGSEEPPSLEGPPQPLPGHSPRLPSPERMLNELRRPRDTDGHTESGKEEAPRPESDRPGESDTSDSEKAPSSETDAKPSTPRGEPRCFCDKQLKHGLQRHGKRKRPLEPRNKGSRKMSRGRRKLQETLAAAEGPMSPLDAEDSSPCPSSQGWEET